jgi:DNA repair protein RadC
MNSINMHDMPVGERPYERFEQVGEHGLSSAELLAIVLRRGKPGQSVTELANEVLVTFSGLAGIAKASLTELQMVSGIGPAKAMEIKSALELGRRLLATTPLERPQIKAPADAANLLMSEMAFLDQEHLRVLLLDTKNCVKKITTVYIGSLNMALVRVGEIFRDALKENANCIVLAHNHPSGDPTPSADDARMTKQVVQAGRLLDIEVLDHVIIGRNKFVSMKELGLGF